MRGRERSTVSAAEPSDARTAAALLAAALAMLTAVTGARGQSPVLEGGSGIEVQYLSFDDPAAAGLESISLVTVPVAGRAAVAEDLTLQIGSTFAHGGAKRADGTVSTLSGLTDTEVSLSYALGREAVTLSAVARIPTGQTEYSAEELDAAGIFASDLFPFRVSNWGSGGGFGVQATSSRSLGEVGTALSVGYFRAGEFDPVEGHVTAYRPGDNVNARAALEIPTGETAHLDLQLGFQWFGEDELQEANVFEAGNRYEAVARYAFPVGGRKLAYLYSGYQRREEGTQLQLAQATASQDLFLVGGGLRLPLQDDLLLRARVDSRVLDREGGTSEGVDLRPGVRLEWTKGSTVLGSFLRGHVGNVTVRDGVESGFQGFDLGFTVRLGRGAR